MREVTVENFAEDVEEFGANLLFASSMNSDNLRMNIYGFAGDTAFGYYVTFVVANKTNKVFFFDGNNYRSVREVLPVAIGLLYANYEIKEGF